MYNKRIISIAQHVHGKDDHGEPLTTMEIGVCLKELMTICLLFITMSHQTH